MSSSLPRRGSVSASLRARRALLLAEGRRRFYVFPLDVGPHSTLGKSPHLSVSDCVASAHAWLQRVRFEDSWWFSVVEKAELNGESVWASRQDILVFNDLLLPSPKRGGCDSRGGAIAPAEAGARVGTPRAGTFKATDGNGVSCRRQYVSRVCTHG